MSLKWTNASSEILFIKAVLCIEVSKNVVITQLIIVEICVHITRLDKSDKELQLEAICRF